MSTSSVKVTVLPPGPVEFTKPRPKRRPPPAATKEEIAYRKRVAANKARTAGQRYALAVKERRQEALEEMAWRAQLEEPEERTEDEIKRDRVMSLARRLNMKRRAAKIQATPSWANDSRIIEICVAAVNLEWQTGMKWHVDHIVPLMSPFVCGLHCEFNLEPVPARENLEKGNWRWPDMP